MIRVAQLYTGGVGSEIVRRLAAHPQLQLVGVLVHSAEKTGRDSGELVGAEPNGITTTQDVDEIIALRPDAAIYSGMLWDHELIARLLEAGINVYTGMGGYFLPGQPEYDALQSAGLKGNASFAAGGNIPGLISDVFPLFLSGYTGRIRHVRAWQRNHVETYPSAAQLEQGLGIGLPPGSNEAEEMVDGGWVWAMRQSANMIATAMGFECTDLLLSEKRVALAPHAVTLPTSGLHIAAGHVAALQWTFSGFAGDHEFLTITNEQSAMLGLGPGWRENHEEPPWRVEIDGSPPIVATFGWPDGVAPATANALLNTARAMNTIPRLVAAPPGCVSVLDFPAVVAGDGLRVD
jgi:4-hydroxy-tetrahydrodipicolinate reductase